VNRPQKEELVKGLNERFNKAKIAVLTEFGGLSVGEMNQLRRELRQVRGEYKVAKNTLTRLAVRKTAYEGLAPALDGQVGLAFGEGDVADVAKVVIRFAEQHEGLRVAGGAIEGRVLTKSEIEELAKLPSKEVVFGQLLAVLLAPATQLVRLMQEPAARIVRLLAELERKRKSEQA